MPETRQPGEPIFDRCDRDYDAWKEGDAAEPLGTIPARLRCDYCDTVLVRGDEVEECPACGRSVGPCCQIASDPEHCVGCARETGRNSAADGAGEGLEEHSSPAPALSPEAQEHERQRLHDLAEDYMREAARDAGEPWPAAPSLPMDQCSEIPEDDDMRGTHRDFPCRRCGIPVLCRATVDPAVVECAPGEGCRHVAGQALDVLTAWKCERGYRPEEV